MTQDGSQDKARIAALEAELDDMTAALAQAWDQLVPFLQETPHEGNDAQDVTPVLETIIAALDADMGALYMLPHEGRGEEWLTLPGNVVEPEPFKTHMAEIEHMTSPLLVRGIRSARGYWTQWLMMPVRVTDQTVGAIGVGLRGEHREFSSLDARTLTRMTDRVASQIAAADLAESKAREAQATHEMQIAGKIQQSLQPVGQIDLPCVQVVADWHPAASVGGDAWGQIKQDEDTLAFFVVDVAGKGLPASLAAVSLHTALTTMLRLGYSPVETVTMLNKQLYDSYTDAGIMATVVVARINVKTGVFEQANAGHTPTLVHLDGAWHEWTATMPPLGVLPEFSPERQHAHLQRGDLVIFYSDGLSEIETPDGLWGSAGLVQAVDNVSSLDAKRAADAILDAASALRGDNPAHDDQTLLNIYFSGSTMTATLVLPADFGSLARLQPFLEDIIGAASDRAQSEIVLAVHELCTNVIEHGYAGVEGTIEIEASMDGGMFAVHLRDHAPNAYEAAPEITAPEPDSLPEGGWGMFIVHQVMDDVRYTRHADGNEWHLTKTL